MWGWIWPKQRVTDGAAYERYVAGLLRSRGWTVDHVGASGDGGVDLVATRRKKRVAVQCKWKIDKHGSVSNSGVQEVHTGMKIHACGVGAVVSNGWFTRGAHKAADATGVILLKDDELSKLKKVAGRKIPWEVWAVAGMVVIGVADLAYATRPAWHKTGVDSRFEVRHVVPRATDTTSVGGPSPITPPRGIRVGLPEGSLVLRCVRWGEMEHGREEKMRGRVNGYDSLFQKCMNDGSLLDEKPEPMVKMGPETEQLLVEKAVRPPRRCDEMNDRKCGGV